MRLLAVLALALVAGCAQPSPMHVKAAFVNAPDPTTLLPNASAFPPGFSLGFEGPSKDPPGGAVDGATAIFERGNESAQARVVVGVLRFGTSEEAAAMRESMAAQMPRHEEGPNGYAGDFVVDARGNRLAWAAATTMGGPSSVDADALVAFVLAR